MAISKISCLAASHALHTAGMEGTKSSVMASKAIKAAAITVALGYILSDRVKAEPSRDLCAPVESVGIRFFGVETKIGTKLKELEEALADLMAEGDKIEKEVKALHTKPVTGAPGSSPDRAYSEAMGALKDRQDLLKAETRAVQKQLERILSLLEAAPVSSPCSKGI